MARRSAIAAVAVAALLLTVLPATTATAGSPVPPPLGLRDRQPVIVEDTDTILVTFDKAQARPAQAAEAAIENPAARVADADIEKVAPITGQLVAVTLDRPISDTEAAKIGDQAEKVPGVKAAEPSTTMAPGATNDTYYSLLWNLKTGTASRYGVNAEGAWPMATGKGAIVGVVDTGITAHPDLSGSSTSIVGGNVVAGYDFISDQQMAGDWTGRDSDPTDEGDPCAADGVYSSSWHGTHVAGTIAALRSNNLGVVGVAPDAKIEPLRALGECGGTTVDIISAMLWGAGVSVADTPSNPNPVSVLNLSLGGSGDCSVGMQTAIDQIVAKGVPIVVAAGNENTALSNSEPANCDNVIRVVASSFEGARAPYSNYGTAANPATLTAPGGSGVSESNPKSWIISTWNFGSLTPGLPGYAGMVGTSMAAPHVAAVAALLKQLDPDLTPAKIAEVLTGTVTPMPACSTLACGAGVVNAAKAVTAVYTPLALAKLATPAVTGVPMVGGQLSTAGAGVTGATYSYRWLRNGTPLTTAATGSSYKLTNADLGTELSVTVTATLNGKKAAKTSDPVMIAPNATTTLAIPVTSGTLRVGQRLTTTGDGATGARYSYQWYRSGSKIKGATKAGYTLTSSDHGKRMTVKVTASLLGISASKRSVATTKVLAGVFTNKTLPYTTGTYAKGKTVKAKYGSWTPSPSKVKYQWLRNGVPISHATKSSYKLGTKDVGTEISVRVTVSRSHYVTTTAISAGQLIG